MSVILLAVAAVLLPTCVCVCPPGPSTRSRGRNQDSVGIAGLLGLVFGPDAGAPIQAWHWDIRGAQAEQLLSGRRRQLYLNIHKRRRLMCVGSAPSWRADKQAPAGAGEAVCPNGGRPRHPGLGYMSWSAGRMVKVSELCRWGWKGTTGQVIA